MLKREIERIVDEHLGGKFKHDTFTKADLRNVLVDILMDYSQSEALSDVVEASISRKLRRRG